MEDVNAHLTTCHLDPVWFVRTELADRDDARIREAVTQATGLRYGDYDGVAFESATGTQFFRPVEGSVAGARAEEIRMPVRVLSFSLPRDAEMLARAIEAIRHSHSYEEPVISVTEGWATRAHDADQRDNPNRWWNRGFAE